MVNVYHTVSSFVHLPMVFLSTDTLFEQRIGYDSIDLAYIEFTYYT